jgi:hypothetical protein
MLARSGVRSELGWRAFTGILASASVTQPLYNRETEAQKGSVSESPVTKTEVQGMSCLLGWRQGGVNFEREVWGLWFHSECV